MWCGVAASIEQCSSLSGHTELRILRVCSGVVGNRGRLTMRKADSRGRLVMGHIDRGRSVMGHVDSRRQIGSGAY